MDTSVSALLGLVRATLSDPRQTARLLMNSDLTMAERWQAFALVVVLTVLLGQGVLLLGPGVGFGNPLGWVFMEAAVFLVAVAAVHQVGRAMGGQGLFGDALLLITWLQVMRLFVLLAQLLALVILPPLASLISLGGLVLILWLLTVFVAELHGFNSLGRVFLMIIVTAVGLSFMLAIVLSALGFSPPGVM